MYMKKGLQKKILGFTLVEIMIVVTIIGILASLAVPAFQRARWKALETSIRNNLRQIWGAAQQYMLENGVSEITTADYTKIFTWKAKTTGTTDTSSEENPGYTSVIQQISEEDYSKIGVYTSGNGGEGDGELSIESYTTDEGKSDGFSGSGMSITEDTQGLIIKSGSRYVKLRL